MADALGLNPGCCEFESRLPHLMLKGDECKAVARQVFQTCVSEFKSRHPCQIDGDRTQMVRGWSVEPVLESSILSDRPFVPRSSNRQDAGL
jgi:hypothetical protein